MLRIDPREIETKDLHQFMLAAVAPRPIAFASTISVDGVPNLAPYSFFNAFSSNPPIVIFSSNRRVANNTTKDTLKNVEDTGEVVINVVSHAIVRQMALASVEFGPEVNEFEKAGFSPLPSELVKPFRVAESPVHMECKVDQIIPLGDGGGAGNLIVCRIVLMHIAESVLNDKGRIDPHKIDLMGRMGRFYYARASGSAVEEIVQDVTAKVIGFDGLPDSILHSTVLTGNNLGQLASLDGLPTLSQAQEILKGSARVSEIAASPNPAIEYHRYAKEALDAGDLPLGAALMVFAQA